MATAWARDFTTGPFLPEWSVPAAYSRMTLETFFWALVGFLATAPVQLTHSRCARVYKESVPVVPKPLPPQYVLLERLWYEPKTGELIWQLPDPQSRVRAGTRFGSKTTLGKRSNSTKTYYAGKFQCVTYLAHRLIWMYMTGEDPGNLMIDHINGNGLDNRWHNLRAVSRSANIANQQGHKRRRSPHKHVYRRGKGWIGQVRRDKILYSTKQFSTSAEAKIAVEQLITKLDNL